MHAGKNQISYPSSSQRGGGNTSRSGTWFWLVLAFLWLHVLAPVPVFGDENSADQGQQATTSVSVHTFFAKFPQFNTPVERLKLFTVSVSSTGLNTGLESSRAAFNTAATEVGKIETDANHDARTMLMAAVNVLRTEGTWWSRTFGERKDAESNFHRRTLTFYVTLLRLHLAEGRLRTAAEEYYTRCFVQAFPALPPAGRQEVLGWFQTRLEALQQAREKTFRAIELRRLQVYRDLLRRAKDAVARNDPHDARIATEARAALESAKNVRDYEWLITETATHLTIYGRLIAAEEAAVSREQLHPALREAVRATPGFRPQDALPDSATAERLAIVKLRARRAQLTEVNRALAVETAYRAKVSILLGTWNVVKEAAGKSLQIAQDGVVNDEYLKALDIYARPGALIAIAYKLFGDSFSLLVSTPLKDIFMQASKDMLGTGWTTSDQDHFAEYEKEMKPIMFRMRLFDRIAERFDESTCRQWIAFFVGDKSGKAAESVPPSVDRNTMRSLVADADFIAATQGGLPAIFEPLVDDPSQRTALLLRGAQYQINADFQAGTRRLAATRGQMVKPEDFASVKKALDTALGPVDPVSGWRDPYVQRGWIYQAIPMVGGIKAVVDLPKITRLFVEFLRGRIQEENSYLEQLATHTEWIASLIAGLETCGWDYAKLHAKAPGLFTTHVLLLAQSPAYVSTWASIKEAENERIKLWRAAGATVDRTLDLTPPGQRLLANDHLVQDIDLATLAVHGAFLRLAYLAQTREYTGAALQVKELPLLEARRQHAKGETPKPIDFSEIEQAFRREALREDLIASYEELYYSSMKEIVLKVGARAMKNALFGVDGAVGAGAAQVALRDNTGEEIWKAFNPWAGKLDAAELRGVVTGALSDSVASITAHYGAQVFTRFQKAEIENAVNIMIAVSAEASAEATQRMLDQTRAWFVPRREVEERYARMGKAGGALARYREEHIAPLQKRFAELDPSDHEGRMAIAREIQSLETGTEMLSLRAQAVAAAADIDGSEERRQRAEDEANEIAGLIANGVATAEATEQTRALNDAADPRVKSVADQLAAADFLKKLGCGFADAEDLARLTNPNDPLRLDRDLFQLGLHTSFLRRALQRAYTAAPDSGDALLAVSRDLDGVRRRRLQALLTEFVNTTAEGAWIERIDHDGAGNNDPEYGGIEDDLNLHVQVRKDQDAARVGDALKRFLKEKSHELGTPAALVRSMAVYDPRSSEASAPTLVRKTAVWDAGQPPVSQRPEGGPMRRLSDEDLRRIEENQGFRRDHAEGMHEYAQRTQSYLVVRDGNPQSVRHFSDPDAIAKPMTCKAKTQDVGPHAGLVVDPTHSKQAAEWTKALDKARAEGDTETYAKLKAAHEEALETWQKYGAEMKSKYHYMVDNEGLVRKPVTVWKDGTWVTEFRKVHGDYDIHGVFHASGDRSTRIPFGDGTEMVDLLTKGFRENMNWYVSNNGKEFILHGGQDDWLHEGKAPDPPVTVFFPDGRPPLRLETTSEMRDFYEKVMRVQWEYATALARGALDSQVRVAPTVSVGSQTFRSRAMPAWFANHNGYRGGVLVGDGKAVWTDIPREHAAALCMDMARQLGFLTDPRYESTALSGLADDKARKERLGAALARIDHFLRLVDAWIIGDEAGHALYAQRAQGTQSAYYHAVVQDAKKLCAAGGADGTPLKATDMANLEQLVGLVGRRDIWAAPGMSLARARELLDWMRSKSIDLVAANAVLWKHNFEALASDAPADTRQRAIEAMRDAVAIATENLEGVPLLKPPLVLEQGGISVMDIEPYRKALAQAMARAVQQRGTLVAAQEASRAALLRAGGGGALDDATRKAIGDHIAAGLDTTSPTQQGTNQMEAGLWALYAELLLSRS